MKSRAFKILLMTSILWMAIYQEASAVQIISSNLRLQKKVKSLREIRDQNVVRQTSDYSCGAAGLSTILNYDLHDPVPENEIMQGIFKFVDIQKVKQRNGFSLLDLKKYSQARGYKVTGYQMDIDFLREMEHPVLVPIKFKQYRHFVIVKGVVGDRVFVADPAMGNMIMKVDWFKRIWQDGIGLVIEPKNANFSRLPSELKVKKEDFVLIGGQNLETKTSFITGDIRAAIFPTEF